MRILLVGEYSRLHNSLKEGLLQLGHEVTIVGSGDGFKNYPVDIRLERGYTSGWRKKLKLIILKITSIDISEIALRKSFNLLKPKLSGYDVVQLINESSFDTTPSLELEIAQYLKNHNKKIFLLSCGADYPSITHAFTEELPYTIVTPFQEEKIDKKSFAPALKYLELDYKELHKELYELIDGVIATDLDYHIPLKDYDAYIGLIPNPINTDTIKSLPQENTNPIIIFHGINRANYFKKGNDIFENALAIIKEKYASKVTIITTESLPYKTYIKKYNSAHIILDQIYSHDQGYNALEAMAKGKIVFTGAGSHFKEHYNLLETVAIDATPDVDQIVRSLEKLIENPETIEEIRRNARLFIETHHNYKKVAQTYIDTWNN
ncbi:glycosyl transferase family 1 [Dokdonia sp. Hel_I_63]|uniref:glycosyltransferase n=1 Tax=unclassified Dokdonia TaxID=2615033 RepID=UPI00020A6699|nr:MULTISPECIES: glycosyltransferase [unclassified Dokdonia]AEE20078.1 glycosyl transferase group 1 [Dokdonia sp. 4H-3-7-5]TVZ23667.1 glycosyl transferase family 1 [Dokdonia sp. Hel_I_63]